MKLGIFYPWDTPFMFTDFVDNVLNLERPAGVETRFFRANGWCSARRHTSGCEKALEWGADLILCIGSDQLYPQDLIPRLLHRYRETKGDIITAMVPFRGYVKGQHMRPFQPLAWRIVNKGLRVFRGIDLDGDMMVKIEPKDGDLQRVNIIGTGVLLMHRNHLLSVKRPWFYDQVNKETLEMAGDMDALFVWRLQTEGRHGIWVDTTIDVKHLNIFQIDHSYQHRFNDLAQEEFMPEANGNNAANTPTELPAD